METAKYHTIWLDLCIDIMQTVNFILCALIYIMGTLSFDLHNKITQIYHTACLDLYNMIMQSTEYQIICFDLYNMIT